MLKEFTLFSALLTILFLNLNVNCLVSRVEDKTNTSVYTGELLREVRTELRRAHLLNLSQQENITNLESIVDEADKKISELQKKIIELRMKDAKAVHATH